MILWCPPKTHDFTHVSTDTTEARYHSIANDVAEVALDPEESPIFGGEDARVRTGLWLLTIASFESGGFAEKIDRDVNGSIKGSGDSGQAHCLMQVHLPYAKMVVDRKTCFRAGLKALHDSFDHCHSMNAYVSGSCEDPRGLAKIYMRRATTYYKNHSFLVEQEQELTRNF